MAGDAMAGAMAGAMGGAMPSAFATESILDQPLLTPSSPPSAAPAPFDNTDRRLCSFFSFPSMAICNADAPLPLFTFVIALDGANPSMLHTPNPNSTTMHSLRIAILISASSLPSSTCVSFTLNCIHSVALSAFYSQRCLATQIVNKRSEYTDGHHTSVLH
mmetsp:Transcript_19450/g.28634  ORF Transcript_19450/g.28634 Transcript_19450/m.28634 type:complete len:161 (-) Transcript_19450:23-505(-)